MGFFAPVFLLYFLYLKSANSSNETGNPLLLSTTTFVYTAELAEGRNLSQVKIPIDSSDETEEPQLSTILTNTDKLEMTKNSSQVNSSKETGKPPVLTPLIDAGKLEATKSSSQVNSSEETVKLQFLVTHVDAGKLEVTGNLLQVNSSKETGKPPFLTPFIDVGKLEVVENSSQVNSSKDTEKPLLLTPLINAGKMEEARNLSRVEPLLDDIKSYSGFLTVDETSKSHLFFWFFPLTKAENLTTTPVILWLDGGPGFSSLIGLFTGNGPFEAIQKGNSTFLKKRVHAWTNSYHMLYIDQPVGTGFSFTERNEYPLNNTEDAMELLYAGLIQFYKVFAEFIKCDLYIAGESYAGKYIPSLGHKIHNAKRHRLENPPLPLKGMMIGNGFSDPENMLDYDLVLNAAGMIDKFGQRKLKTMQNNVKYSIRSKQWSNASQEFMKMLQIVLNLAGAKFNYYDYTKDVEYVGNSTFGKFIVQDQIRQRLHVGKVHYQIAFSDEVEYHFHEDVMQSVRPWVEKLLGHYPILFYNGQLDIAVSHLFTANFLDQCHWDGAFNFSKATKDWWVVNKKLAGFYKVAANLVFVVVRNAGHTAAKDQPENVKALIDRFIERKFLPTPLRL